MATALHHGSLVPAFRTPAARRTSRGRFAAPRVSTIERESRRRERTVALQREARTRELRRTYRRRQMGVVAAILAIAVASIIGVFAGFGASAAADGNTAQSASAAKFVVVQPGDTLWSIGERIAPNASITEVVDELVRLNGPTISAGQLVRIP